MARLKLLANLRKPVTKFKQNALYIKANGDRVIADKMSHEISLHFSLAIVSINGPHFLLQAEPEQCAQVIAKNLSYFTDP